MQYNTDHIRTTHGGNLPRPPEFDALIASDRDAALERLPAEVEWVVAEQEACGLDVINDGEYVKAANASDYTGYIHPRVAGWEWQPVGPDDPPRRIVGHRDAKDFSGFYESGLWLSGSGGPIRPGFATPGPPKDPTSTRVCVEPLRYVGQEAIAQDVEALTTALRDRPAAEGFIAALGPISLAFVGSGRNEFYDTELDYLMACAEVMREEYRAVTDAGLVVQVDEPQFATSWMFRSDSTLDEHRQFLRDAVDVVNHAIDGLPTELVRFHTCWGSGHRPHVHDIELQHIVDLMVQIDAGAYAFEASNVRHEHEWRVWADVDLPEDKILVPGVVGHATDLVEHPDLVAERLMNFATVVDPRRLQGGTDCGIGSRVGHAEIAWAKLRSLAKGAAIASKRLGL